MLSMDLVDFLVSSESLFISLAITANPLPVSPALEASMDAFNDIKYYLILDITFSILAAISEQFSLYMLK